MPLAAHFRQPLFVPNNSNSNNKKNVTDTKNTHNNNNRNDVKENQNPQVRPLTTMAVNKRGGIQRSDSVISELHNQRIRMAGRIGTKRFVDPCKVFIGNLPYTATESCIRNWFSERMGLPATVLFRQVKLVTHWQTGQSKGYAFLDFTEPIYATVCIEKCHNTNFQGRILSVSQGKKKGKESELYIVPTMEDDDDGEDDENDHVDANRDPPLKEGDEDIAIRNGIRQAMMTSKSSVMASTKTTTITTTSTTKATKTTITTPSKPPLTPEEIAMIRRLDPDLVPSDGGGMMSANGNTNSHTNENDVMEELLLEDDDDDDSNDDDGIDGYWYGDEEEENEIVTFDETLYMAAMEPEQSTMMNRERRREAERRQKRRKLPHKGFG